jgi:hypothetical protein
MSWIVNYLFSMCALTAAPRNHTALDGAYLLCMDDDWRVPLTAGRPCAATSSMSDWAASATFLMRTWRDSATASETASETALVTAPRRDFGGYRGAGQCP